MDDWLTGEQNERVLIQKDKQQQQPWHNKLKYGIFGLIEKAFWKRIMCLSFVREK